MGYQTTLVTVKNRITTVTPNRPEYSNVFTRESYAEITDAMKDLDSRGDVGSIVAIGAGRCFFTGGDIRRFKALIDSREYLGGNSIADVGNISIAIHECPKSVIAMINGVATGTGLSYALACDFRVVTPSSKVIMAFVDTGLCGDMGSIHNLTRLTGPDKAELLMMAGDTCHGEDCVRMGFAIFLTGEGRLQETVCNLASKLVERFSATRAGQKRLIKKYFYGGLADFAVDEGKEITAASRLSDFTETVNAFLEKRMSEYNK